MMRGRHADRIWLGIGAAGVALLLATGWFLLISPMNAEADSFREQAEITEIRLVSLRQRLVELEQQRAKLPEYQAQLARDKAALPADSGVPAFLRQLQSAGDSVGATVTSVTVGAPAEAMGGGAPVYALPITLTAESTADRLGLFLDQLQQVQPRAVLVEAANLAGSGGAKKMNLTLTMKAFVAPDTGQPAPKGDN